MTGNLTIDKASMNISYFLCTIKLISENGGRIVRHDFVEKMAAFMGTYAQKNGKENRTPYNKSKLPRYFGFVDIDTDADGNSYLILTNRGAKLSQFIVENADAEPDKRYSIAQSNRADFINLIFESVIFDSFGKNNCGAEQSNTDVEPPKIVFKAIKDLGRASAEEICYVMFGLNNGLFKTYESAIKKVKENRNAGKFDYSEIMSSWEVSNIVNDCKIINIFTDDNIRLLYSERDETNGKLYYYLSPSIEKRHLNQIDTIDAIYMPLRLFVYTDGNEGTVKEWVNDAVLGGVSDDSFVFRTSLLEAHLFGYTDNGTFIPGIFEKALIKAFNNEKKNVFVIIEDVSEQVIQKEFGDMHPLLEIVNNLESEKHGWSKNGCRNVDAYNYIISNCRNAKSVLSIGELLFPSNLQIVGTMIMDNNSEQTKFDYEFTRCLVKTDKNENESDDFLQHSLFGIHMTGTNDALSTDNPHISIGWSGMGDLSSISTFEDLTNKYDETWPDVDASKKSQDLTQIWSFYHESQPGDYVVYSSGALCHIGRIVDGYYYDANERPEQDPDYKNCHKVEWIKLNIAKSDIPKTLRNALMAQRSFWRMDKHKYAVLDLLQDDDSATEENTQTDSDEQEKLYKEWLKKQTKPDGGKYSDNTIYAYIRQMKRGYDAFGKYNGYASVFQITQTSELDEYMEQLFNETGFSEFNENNGNQACKYGLMKYREYLDELESYEPEPDESVRLKVGRNIILYGVPGAGKSWTIKNDYCKTEDKIERLVFHPDYTYSDFVGQILPKVKDNGGVSYEFTPGPFTTLVRKAYRDPQNEYFLVIEEVNRGNAPAIFGDIFQLLDRNKSGGSEYEITNPDIAKVIYKNSEHKVSIPSNMSILCTMNTSDQNVFTLDTAFQRRWSMRLIKNEFSKEPDEVKFAETLILDTDVTWQKFFTEINDLILKKNIRMTSSEDKRLGTHFVAIEDLRYDDYAGDDANKKREAIQQNKRFAEKVLKYLWDDAFKFNKDEIFDISKVNSLEKVIDVFVGAQGNARFAGIFKENIVSALIPSKQGG